MTQDMKTTAMQEGIKKALNEMATSLVAEGKNTSVPWTAKVLDTLTNEGNKQGFYTCAPEGKAPKATYRSEWLFDTCWLKYNEDENESLRQLALAAECEWHVHPARPHFHRDDFEKLVVARADLRLLVCEVQRETQVAKLIEVLESYASGFNDAKGDEYMISCWIADKERFAHESFVVGQ